MAGETAARGLGWASLGIGLSEILMPGRLQQMMGMEEEEARDGVLRTLGVREIMHGVDILMHDDPTPGVWGRVAGDGLDSVLLGLAVTKTKKLGSFGKVAAAVAGIAVLDILFAWWLGRQEVETG